jgi:hypothetical protein
MDRTLGGSDPMLGGPSYGRTSDDRMKEKASEVTSKARGQAVGAIDSQKDQVSSLLDKVADAMEGDRIGGYAATYARRGAEFLRSSSADDLMTTARTTARERPAVIVAASFVAGFALARLVRR